MMGLLDELRVRVVEPHDMPGFDLDHALANVNSPDDLHHLEAGSRGR